MPEPQPKRRSRFRKILLYTVGVFAIGLVGLHLYYPLPYVYRVMVLQYPDYGDIHRFPSRSIEASASPRDLPIVLDDRMVELLEQHPGIEDFGVFLEETETTAFLVVHKGRIVVEQYGQGNDRDSMQNTFSVSKSFASALVGLAVRDGAVRLDDPITTILPELEHRDGRFAEITIEHLLDMRSGIRYSSDVKFPIVNADNPLIYYSLDLESVLLERTEIASTPGPFQYNNYNTPLIGLSLHRAMGMSASEYLQRELWQPMGAAQSAGWTVDERGLERMESGFHARARDLARFGQLYLDQGMVDDRRVIPEAWVLDSTDLAEPLELDAYDGRTWRYRLGWWIVPRSEGRSDYCAIGRDGQFIYISPQHEVVFVRNGPGRGNWGDRSWTELFYRTAERLERLSSDGEPGDTVLIPERTAD